MSVSGVYMEYKDLKIEKASDGDCCEVARLYDELNDYLAAHANHPGWKKGVYPTLEDARSGLAEGCLYVVRLSGRIAGTFMLRHRPEPGYALANWNSELDYSQILVLYTFAVHPDFLGCGLGKRMMDFITDLAVKAGDRAIRLDVYKNNVPAIALYEKCGFEYVDTVDLGYGEYGLDLYRLYQKLLPQAG